VVHRQLLHLAETLVTVLLVWPPGDVIPGTGSRPPGLAGLAEVPAFLDRALTGVPWASALAVAGSVALLARTGLLLRWALPTAALLVFSALRYHAPHHDPLPFLVLVHVLWIAAGRARVDPAPATARVRAAALVALVPLLVVQVGGWARAWRADVGGAYSTGSALAAYLAELDEDAVVYGYDPRIIGALPYLEGNPYANLRGGRLPGYWTHGVRDVVPGGMDLVEVTRDRPDVVVWGVQGIVTPLVPGYRVVHRFEGLHMGRDGPTRRDDVVVYERAERPPS